VCMKGFPSLQHICQEYTPRKTTVSMLVVCEVYTIRDRIKCTAPLRDVEWPAEQGVHPLAPVWLLKVPLLHNVHTAFPLPDA
jgi:hypothetical protein